MPKPMYVWSGSAWVSVAAEVESLATYATQSYADNAATVASGIKLLTPSSIAVGSGSGSVTSTGTVTFSAASSVSLNDVFSATYDNYLIQFNNLTASGNGWMDMRMRVAGSDVSSANYNRQDLSASSTTVAGARSTSQTAFTNVQYLNTGVPTPNQMNLYNPFNTSVTSIASVLGPVAGGSIEVFVKTYGLNTSTSYTGFTIYPQSGTITGGISVYGYKE